MSDDKVRLVSTERDAFETDARGIDNASGDRGRDCGVAASAMAGLIWNVVGPHADTIQTHRYEQQEKRLADGSILYLGPQAQIHLQFNTTQRVVDLVRGEAVFEVAKDPLRPFVVTTHSVAVQAAGTKFEVVSSEQSIVVTVSEGVVKISRRELNDAVESHAVTLAEGEQLTVAKDHALVTKVDAERKLAWTQGWLVFKGETVQQAVTEFNRRNRVQIQVPDEVGQRRLDYIRIRSDNPTAFARTLAWIFNLRLARVDSTTWRLESR